MEPLDFDSKHDPRGTMSATEGLLPGLSRWQASRINLHVGRKVSKVKNQSPSLLTRCVVRPGKEKQESSRVESPRQFMKPSECLNDAKIVSGCSILEYVPEMQQLCALTPATRPVAQKHSILHAFHIIVLERPTLARHDKAAMHDLV